MKKILASLALVALATGAFAQDARTTWAGYLDTGLTAQFNGDNKAYTYLWADDAWAKGGRVRLYGSGVYGDAGAKFELRLNDWSDSAGKQLTIQNAYVYANFFNKMLYTQVGKIQDYNTRSGGNLGATFTKDILGAAVTVKPIDGLAISAYVAPATGKQSGTQFTGVIADLATNGAGYAPTQVATTDKNTFSNTITAVSAAYTLKDTIKVVGGARMFTNPVNAYVLKDFYAAAGLLIDPALTAWVEGTGWNLNDGAARGINVYTLLASYDLNGMLGMPIKAGLTGEYYMYGDDYRANGAVKSVSNTTALGASYRADVWASYALDGGLVPRFDVIYVAGAEATSKGWNAQSGYKGWDTIDATLTPTSTIANYNKVAVVHVKPSLAVNLANGQTVTLVYILSDSIGSEGKYLLSANKSALLHTVQANYTFKF